ncbi:calcium/sodium antiporter [Patescibacteria group bacterium]|nr:calcium/sodium antiporter [Patescibacteria group bacterium]MBU4162312.1 calcium/sodium antiporter [Patescibacteria group bacterium]
MLFFWIIIFIVSLCVMVKGADWLLKSAEKIGLSLGISPFIIGVTIVGIGTSFPELISSIVAVFKGVTEIVPANAIGSNIANILLIVGISAVIGKRLVITKSLIDLDLPLLAISTVIFLGAAWDQKITLIESLFLVFSYGIYLLYTFLHKEEATDEIYEVLPGRADRRGLHLKESKKKSLLKRPKIGSKDFIILIIGIIGLAFGAKYLIDSVIKLSELLNIGAGVISLAAVALGTSLPELLVSAKAAWQKKSEVALGNIFGSNVFNILVVVGLPGLFRTIHLDAQTFSLGLPVLIVATFLFIISGISRRIHIWEGAMYLVVYVFFIGKLFGLF